MCSGSERKSEPTKSVMGSEVHGQEQDGQCLKFSILLELAASDNVIAFINAVEEEGQDIDEASLWYGRKIGSKKLGFELRTPLMIASMYGSKNVLTYIVGTGCVDLNRASGSDGATALHLAASGGAPNAPEVVRILLDAHKVDANGNRPGDMKVLGVMLQGQYDERVSLATPRATKDGSEKKEYPIDPSLPDIKSGIYGSDEFRMYAFKIKPCSRAYSHDWTECPFVHPGENARRRDPRKYHYSCVPCPEVRKGSCRQGDACEYAHGIFECWLHPAQYRTRLCKDETGCNRRVCFFAHKVEELRPLYASTGSGVPSPKSYSANGTLLEPASISPLALGSSLEMASSPPTRNSWLNQNQNQNQIRSNVVPPHLQPPGSRLKSTFSVRDVDLDMELLGLGNHHLHHQVQQQPLMEESYSLSSPSSWSNPFGGSLEGLSPDNGSFLSQNMTHKLLSGYPTNKPLSPARASPALQRSSAFAQRSQSFIERHNPGLSSPAWSSPGGKLDWSVKADELSKLRKSASFGIRSSNNTYATTDLVVDEPDVSWVQSLVKDMPSETLDQFGYNVEEKNQNQNPTWAEQLYLDQEQMVA